MLEKEEESGYEVEGGGELCWRKKESQEMKRMEVGGAREKKEGQVMKEEEEDAGKGRAPGDTEDGSWRC